MKQEEAFLGAHKDLKMVLQVLGANYGPGGNHGKRYDLSVHNSNYHVIIIVNELTLNCNIM